MASPLPAGHGSAVAPALDIGAGVERMMGNRALYLRALARFRSDYRDAGMAIRAAGDAGDMVLAQRLVHTLKGAAGMVEARTLHAAATALDHALRHGEGEIAALLVRLEMALAQVLRELDAMTLAEEAPRTPAPAAADLVPRLRAMLDIGDGAAVELAQAARLELIGKIGEWEYAQLNAAIADFDYERALELLDRPERTGA